MNQEYCRGKIHVIKKGDTLYKISRMYNVPLTLVLRANPYTDIYNLQVGDEICIPTILTNVPVQRQMPASSQNQPMSSMPVQRQIPESSQNRPSPSMPMQQQMPASSQNQPMSSMPMQRQVSESLQNQPISSMPMQRQIPESSQSQPISSMPMQQQMPEIPESVIFPLFSENESNMESDSEMNRMDDDCEESIIQYTVMEDDTIASILEQFDISLDDLLEWNAPDNLFMQAGSKINIKRCQDF